MAIKTIIVGSDLSAPSDQALDRALAIAEHHKATLILVHGQSDDTPKSTNPRADEQTTNAIVQQLEEVSAAVRAEEARMLANARPT